MKPKKNLISLVRVLVKPEYQNEVIERAYKQPLEWMVIPPVCSQHGLAIQMFVKDGFEDEYHENDWNDYPKFKPRKNGFYFVRFDNQAEYLRRWIDGDWYDLTGKTKSRSCKETTEFKFYKEEL